jgi:HPt (histidine-containing phosphotransfer) domain-containing protein
VEAFLSETDDAIAAISDRLERRETDEALARQVHQTAGSSALVGAVALRDSLVALEERLGTGAAPDGATAATLLQVWSETRDALGRHPG